MADNVEDSDIKLPLRKIVKELTQRYVKEIVKEATKLAARSKKENDIQKLKEAMKRLSDREKEDLFKGTADRVNQKIYEGKTKDEDLVRELSNIIQRDLGVPEIVARSRGDVPKPRSRWKGFLVNTVKLWFVVVIVVVGIQFIYSNNPFLTDNNPSTSNHWKIPGTGDIQATLTWYSKADIDLHVEDPDGDEIYYGNPNVPSGGQLDMDNKCENFEMGKPENIFWPEGEAPRGTYKVSVIYFSDCDKNTGPVDWTVTTKVNGRVNTFRGTLHYVGETQYVTTLQFQ
jgi:hypothetical protein